MQTLQIVETAHQVLQLLLLWRWGRPGVGLLRQAKAGDESGIALIGFDAEQFALAVAFDAQGINDADTIASLMEPQSHSPAIGAGRFQADMHLTDLLGAQPVQEVLMGGRRVVIAAMDGFLKAIDALEVGIKFGCGDIDTQDAGGSERGHRDTLLSPSYGRLHTTEREAHT